MVKIVDNNSFVMFCVFLNTTTLKCKLSFCVCGKSQNINNFLNIVKSKDLKEYFIKKFISRYTKYKIIKQ